MRSLKRVSAATALFIAGGLGTLPSAGASGLDLHRMWDSVCAECHGHSADFARTFLSVVDGKLRGPHPVRDTRLFLEHHYVPDTEVDAVYRMLLAQTTTPPRFKNECERCHDTAANFVRSSLHYCNDVLCGKESGQPVVEFLAGHRKLSPDAAGFFADLLTRVGGEVFR